ncbi:RNB domain-containing ribonuclease [Patescibacteria group bacterium]|nr:RNB domain-containing ribonuclease [Patescibacteria group bacterium]
MKLPGLYRIHDLPNPSSLEKIAPALALFGVKVPKNVDPSPEFYQPIVDRLSKVDGGHIAQRFLLRTLMRAEYAAVNRGHFGLASPCYCHFTSPIRRYPDLTIHRLFDQWLADGPRAKRTKNAAERFEALGETGRQLSTLERRAQEAERSAKTLLLLDMMKSKIGETFAGVVTGVVARGVFVRIIPLGAEGFVRVTDLPDDRWFHSREDATLTGRRTGRTIAIGQPLRVVVEAVDRHARDMSLVPADDKIGTVKGSAGHRGRAREPVSSKRRSRPPKGRRSRKR